MFKNAVVIDTSVFVAPGFNKRSDAAKVIDAIREGRVRLVWNKQTQGETKNVLKRIPPCRGKT